MSNGSGSENQEVPIYEQEYEADWTEPRYCPYCGSEDIVDRDTWEQREYDSIETPEDKQVVFRIHGHNVCGECGGEFETKSEANLGRVRHKTYTLQFVSEDRDGDDESVEDVEVVQIVEGDDEDPVVVSERSRLNMFFGGASEVQGPEYAVRNLFEFICSHSDIEGEIKVDEERGVWLSEANVDNERTSGK